MLALPRSSSCRESGPSLAISGVTPTEHPIRGRFGSVVNPDTGKPILTSDDQLRRADFRKVKHSELILPDSAKARLPFHSALWQADNSKIHRMAPVEFIGRYLNGFFDYGIADEVHELKGETAQGNAWEPWRPPVTGL